MSKHRKRHSRHSSKKRRQCFKCRPGNIYSGKCKKVKCSCKR